MLHLGLFVSGYKWLKRVTMELRNALCPRITQLRLRELLLPASRDLAFPQSFPILFRVSVALLNDDRKDRHRAVSGSVFVYALT